MLLTLSERFFPQVEDNEFGFYSLSLCYKDVALILSHARRKILGRLGDKVIFREN